MKKAILTLVLIICSGIAMAQNGMVLNGDFDNDGKITVTDISILSDIIITKSTKIAGVIEGGNISLRSVNKYTPSSTSFLMGDINGDNCVTVLDITLLIGFLSHPEQCHYAIIRDGKIVQGYLVGKMFILIGEDKFIDDGEEDLLTNH